MILRAISWQIQHLKAMALTCYSRSFSCSLPAPPCLFRSGTVTLLCLQPARLHPGRGQSCLGIQVDDIMQLCSLPSGAGDTVFRVGLYQMYYFIELHMAAYETHAGASLVTTDWSWAPLRWFKCIASRSDKALEHSQASLTDFPSQQLLKVGLQSQVSTLFLFEPFPQLTLTSPQPASVGPSWLAS